MSARKVVAIDNVLAQAQGFVNFSNSQRSAMINESGINCSYKPDKYVFSVLKRITKCSLVILTSRRKILQSETKAWIDMNFPDIFQKVYHADIWDEEVSKTNISTSLSRGKAELCQKLGVNYLVDDQSKHCNAVADSGTKELLFGGYSWNRSGSVVNRISRVSSWKEVAEYFNV